MLTSRTHRPAVIGSIVFALLAFAITGVAPAGGNERSQAAELAQERYYSSYGDPETIAAGTAAAEAQERYYSSYGEPASLTVAQSPESSDEAPWLPIALSIAAALAIAVASTTAARRLRRAARVTT
jgi:hypothetical protein